MIGVCSYLSRRKGYRYTVGADYFCSLVKNQLLLYILVNVDSFELWKPDYWIDKICLREMALEKFSSVLHSLQHCGTTGGPAGLGSHVVCVNCAALCKTAKLVDLSLSTCEMANDGSSQYYPNIERFWMLPFFLS